MIAPGAVYAEEGSGVTDGNYGNIDYFQSVINMVKDKYKGDVTERQLIEGALKGMFDTMDPYTTYFTNEEANSFLGDIEGSYEGIGVSFTKEGEEMVVTEVFKSSPAEESGMFEGDIIVEVNGTVVTGKTTDEVASLIKGEEGTKVSLGIKRDGEKELIKMDVLRRKISLSPVTHDIVGDIGVIKLDMFSSNASHYVDMALEEMDKNNIDKIILDLRDNPGGEVSQAVRIARNFVPAGIITKLGFKSESQKDEEYHSELENLKYKLVLLVNNNSASASEILAGAVQDTEAGVLVGTKTYGKGKVQNIYPVLSPESYKKYEEQLGANIINAYDLRSKFNINPDDDEIIGWTKITTGAYYTPKGRMIDGTGLEPDIYIENEHTINNIDVRSVSKLRKTVKPLLNTESVDVYYAEKILLLSGYDVGTPDLIMDERTFLAVKEFQKDTGLFSYGVLDYSTQQALNDKLDELVLRIDKQYAKALELLKD
jgi:carboxyl-terminal processing protease